MKTISPAADCRPARLPMAADRGGPRTPAPFVRGFGTLIRQAHTLQTFIATHLRGIHSAEIDSTLDGQRQLITSGLSLLERCCATLPHPRRFRTFLRGSPADGAQPAAGQSGLAHIVAQHLSLRRGLDALAEQRTEEEPGELLLARAARSHAKMAWTLAALLKHDEAAGREHEARTAASNWENEGGAPEFAPAVVRSRLLPAGA